MPPRKFKTAKDFQDKFNNYINECDKKDKLPNVAGFCVYASMNRDTFYAQKEYYSDTYNKINYQLEDEALNNKSISDTMKIFYMKNKCGYRDKQEVDNKVSLSYEDKLKEMTDDNEY